MSLYWTMTLNNYTDEEYVKVTLIANLVMWAVVKVIIAKEHEEEGTPHLQAYWVFKNKKKLEWMKDHVAVRAHWEYRQGNDKQAWDYCMKEDAAPFIWPPGSVGKDGAGQGRRKDLIEIMTMVKEGKNNFEIIEKVVNAFMYQRFIDSYRASWMKSLPHVQPTVWYVEGSPESGKTSTIFDYYAGKSIFTTTDARDMKFGFDGYAGEEIVIIDDFNMLCKDMSFYFKILDRYRCQVEVKGSNTILMAKQIFILSNYSLEHVCDQGGLDDMKRLSFKRRIHKMIKMPAVAPGHHYNFITGDVALNDQVQVEEAVIMGNQQDVIEID
nr:MAG: replication associated protein [Arizlama virus]